MARSIAVDTRDGSVVRRGLDWLRHVDGSPATANTVLLVCWVVTRLVLVAGMVMGRHYSDPQFYHYAGEFAAGRLPYRDVPVEYPPFAVLLLILPALPLLPFASIAPRPDPAFANVTTRLPQPDPGRYAAYGLSFAVEMLVIDVLTLWLVRRAAQRFAPADRHGLRSGLLYIGLVFVSGAVLQKFDLVVGSLCLAAVLALVERRDRLAWSMLGLAILVKGFPVVAVPLFAGYVILRDGRAGAAVIRRRLLVGGAWLAGVIGLVTVAVAAGAGLDAVTRTVLYHTGRQTEIESLYANVVLALGWLPGLGAHTAFSPSDLSRVVLSPLNATPQLFDRISLGVTVVLVIAVYVAYARGWLLSRALSRRVDGTARASLDHAINQLLLAGVAGVLSAFMLGFLALPAHYLLVVLPLSVLLRGRPRPTRSLIVAAAAVAALGQIVTGIWPSLVALEPGAVVVLSLRNVAWIGLLVALVVALWRPALVGEGASGAAVSVEWRPRWRSMRRAGVAWWRERLRSAPPIPGFAPRAEDVFAHWLSGVSTIRLVVISGTLSAVVYVSLVVAFPLTLWWSHPHAPDNPNVINDMGRIAGYNPFAALAFVVAILALFQCQFLALIASGRLRGFTSASWSERIAAKALVLFPIIFIAIMIWMQPVTTTDLYGYVARGYLFAHLNENPMVTRAQVLPGGLSVNRPEAPYGPAWLLITGAVSLLTGENLLASMVVFKLVVAVAAIAGIWLVDRLARELYPQRRLRILVLFAWSPLLLFESIGNGHNDIVMMVFVLGAFLCMLKGRARLAFALLVLGALVKYVSAVFIPLWVVYELHHLARRRQTETTPARAASRTSAATLRETVIAQARVVSHGLSQLDRRKAFWLLGSAAAIGAVLVVAFYAPFWDGIATFTGLGQQLRPLYYNGSIVAFVTAPLQVLVPSSQYSALDKTVRLVFYVLFGLYTLVQIQRLWVLGSRSTLRDIITASAKIAFAALILITFWFQPWYVMWFVPLAALAREAFVRRQGTIFAAGALLTYAISNFVFIGTSDLSRDLFVQFFVILVTFVPLLVLRAAPYEQGWISVVRQYTGLIGSGLARYPVFWERLMLGLILIVAAMLRLLRLGNLYEQLPTEAGTLKAISGDLKLVLADPQGLRAPFAAIQSGLVAVLGPTPLAALLPSALLGTLTVYVIYLLSREIMMQSGWKGANTVALLAALLAATSRWHVSLSRSGMEIVLLPLLMATATYWLLKALRLGGYLERRLPPARRRAHRAKRAGGSAAMPATMSASVRRQTALLFAGSGACTGLASDLAPGLWLIPVLLVGFLLVWRVARPRQFARWRLQVAALVGSALVVGLPALGFFLARTSIGLPPGSPILARSTASLNTGPGILTPVFWGQVAQNVGDVVRVVASQDYTSGYPVVGTSPIIPVLLTPVFVLGLVILLVRWREATAMTLLLLIALPVVASVAIGTPAGIIEAASVLPATCIVPALALYQLSVFVGRLPIVIDRMSGVRMFTTPEQIGRIVLLLFLVASTVRTFFWYFEATLPARPPNSRTPSWIGPPPGSDATAYRGSPTGSPLSLDGPLWEIARR